MNEQAENAGKGLQKNDLEPRCRPTTLPRYRHLERIKLYR